MNKMFGLNAHGANAHGDDDLSIARGYLNKYYSSDGLLSSERFTFV
jgi:hypothetical protein